MSYNQAQIRNILPIFHKNRLVSLNAIFVMKRYCSNICCRTTSAEALQWQVVELTLKYANFEAKFRY